MQPSFALHLFFDRTRDQEIVRIYETTLVADRKGLYLKPFKTQNIIVFCFFSIHIYAFNLNK